ncbi:MAG: type IV pili methyl-accepting chemotaxis transducer N-terminal domain-containing protein [Pseudomonadota bacterium]
MTTLKSLTRRAALCAAIAVSPTLLLASESKIAEPTPASFAKEIGASERVEAAGLLRVLSQEAANAACHISHDVSADEARQLLAEVKSKFSKTIDALEFGNPEMNINGAETRRKTLIRIEDVRTAWGFMKDAAYALLDDPKNPEALATVKAENENVLKITSNLTNDIAGVYSGPGLLLKTDVMLLTFTSRQAMQAQKMGKHACAIWSGDTSDTHVDGLTSTMEFYDATLTALINGMPAMGILAAPTPEISTALREASQDWGKTKTELKMVLEQTEVDNSLKADLFHDLNLAMRQMQTIEKLYAKHAKHRYVLDSTD